MEGQILGNRYELLEKIGGGGMALVYKARCRMLNRFVAVKILRPEFFNDEEFVKRFLIEAQAAASLSHPNIVSIYDVGHEDDIHYIVMEYVNGITLKEYINQKGALPWRDSINIAIQICSAIEHAHRNHIVHRDIKPHNILLTKDGIAKVTDFGIARAVSSSTITMAGTTIGSVHYFSPEQARGGFIDEKSDLYSLGVALYEMVTGRLPFNGETPVAVALKHIQEEAQEPVELDNQLPMGVNDIIMKAMKKDQTKRYQTASDMLHDLYRVGKEPEGGFILQEAVDDSPTKRVKVIAAENIVKKDDDLMKGKDSEKQSKKSDRLTIWLAVVTSLVIIAVFMFITYRVVSTGGKPVKDEGFEVLNYVGKNVEDVKDDLKKEGINVRETRKADDKVNKDIILSQKIEPGKKLKPGAAIDFEVSDGPKLVKLPDLRKVEYRMAESKLQELDLMPRVEEEHHETIASGLITRTDPKEGEEVKAGTVVTIYKSTGPEIKQTEVPDLSGKTLSEAKKLLAESKLTLGSITPEGSNVVDKIISQRPAARTKVNQDTPVDIVFGSSNTGSTGNTANTGNTGSSTDSQKKMVYEKLSLMDPQKYGDKIKVRAEAIPSDTNKVVVIMDETKNKSDFPITLQIPVPEKGSTKVQVYLDNKPYATLTSRN